MNETLEQPAIYRWTSVCNYVSFSVDTAMQAVMDLRILAKRMSG